MSADGYCADGFRVNEVGGDEIEAGLPAKLGVRAL
jgi:hypothetical protein